MPVTSECFDIVCLRCACGFNEKTYSAIKELVEQSKPDIWNFLSPNSFLIYYLTNRSSGLASQLIESAQSLRQTDSLLTDLQIGSSKGNLVIEKGMFGGIKAIPMGTAVNDAMQTAASDNR